MKKKVTIRDIGNQLGLSAMTISLALRDHPRISARTKARVLAALEATGYRPNRVARALATGKSNLIGVVVPNSSDQYYAEVIRAIEDAARAADYHVLLSNGSYELEHYAERVREMLSLHVQGLIAAPPFTSERPKLPPFWHELQRDDFQIVLINRQLRPALFHQVAADYMAGVKVVIDALAARGHRRVAYISGTPAMLPIRQRLAAFRRHARQAGLAQEPTLFEYGALTYAGGYEAGQRLWQNNRVKPTAVVAFSDVVAVGLLRFLEQTGIQVPEEVSVVSFDGTPVGAYTHISLTTVATPMYEIGQRAFQLLLDAMAGKYAVPQSIILPVELELRESIGSAPAAR